MHYMVDIKNKLLKIMEYVNDGQYFTINRARQYGKTTTLHLLEKALPGDYMCVRLSFEGVGDTMFKDPASFCQRFLLQVSKVISRTDNEFASMWLDQSITDFDMLGYHIEELCKNKKIILMIDEVDQTSNNRVFLQFLGMLRSKYLSRNDGYTHAFHSVILAGVHDVKNIKLKLLNEGLTQSGDAGHLYNSPWNIAADFNVDMSFMPDEIATMLDSYETEHDTGMCISSISNEIYKYTKGYPFLVSRICKHIDEKLSGDWSLKGVQSAVRIIVSEKNVLFDDIIKNLENSKDIYDILRSLLFNGKKKALTIHDPIVEWCSMFGLISIDEEQNIHVANKIFEVVISRYFVSKAEGTTRIGREICSGIYSEIVRDGVFDMENCLRKFASFYKDVFTSKDVAFLEENGRLVFLSFLFPLINGRGFYHIESQFTDLRRMDIVVDYGHEQFIIELKLWKGEKAQDRAYAQLLDYMDSKHLEKGYLLTFDFRKEWNKTTKAEWVQVGGKQIFEVIV